MTDPVTTVQDPDTIEVVTEAESTAPVTTTAVESTAFDSDAFVEKVAERVFDKMKGFTTSLLTATEAAQQIAQEMVPMDNTPVPPATPEEIQEDSKPQRRHKMFAQPMKRRDQ
jgi:hypothetical protein